MSISDSIDEPRAESPRMDTERGPRPWLISQLQRVDALLSLIAAEDGYAEKRSAADGRFDYTMHDAIHAVKRMREFADMLGPKWSSALRSPTSDSAPSLAESPRAQRVADIEARANAATVAPWRLVEDGSSECTVRARGPVVSGVVATVRVAWVHEDQRREQAANAQFITHARSDIPWLLGELASVQRALTEAKQKLDKVTEAEYRALEEAARQRDIVRNTQQALTAAKVRAEEGFAAHAHSFSVLDQIRLLLNQDDLDDYQEVVRGVERLQRALAAKWREASSAPKTGEHILVTDYAGRGFGICGGHWQDWCAVVHYWSNPGEEGFYLSTGASDPHDDRPFTFSHWMPLPSSAEEPR